MINNKGFAISTILYGLLTMGILVLFLLVGLLNFNRKNNNEFVDNNSRELNEFAIARNKEPKK